MKLFDRDGNLLTRESITGFLKSKRYDFDEFPQWSLSEVLKPDLNDCRPLNEMTPVLRQVEFNLVVGTTHDSYNRSSWAQMLLGLPYKRVFDLKMAYASFDDPNEKNPVHVIKLNGKYVISGDGNHRVCLGKFGWRSSFPALVTDWVEKF